MVSAARTFHFTTKDIEITVYGEIGSWSESNLEFQVKFPDVVRVKVDVDSPPLIYTVTLATDTFTSIVTVNPLSIIALSPVPGTLCPDEPPDEAAHVDVELQLPVATEYLVTPPHATAVNIIVEANNAKIRKEFFITDPFRF